MNSVAIAKQRPKAVLDSRFLKVLAVKRDEIKDALVFVQLDESKYGLLDVGQLRNLAKDLEALEPGSCWLPTTRKYSLSFIDLDEMKDRNLLVTVSYEDPDMIDPSLIEAQFRQAIPNAKSLSFVHQKATIEAVL